MLKAVLRNKSHRRLEASLTGGSYDGTEDLLTASVFTRLSYLDDDCLIAILADLCPGTEWAEAGSLVQVRFWPRYVVNERTVEPDVVFEFDRLLVWVEAKRWDGLRLQSPEQLHGQFRAMRLHALKNQRMLQIAIGGHGKSFIAGRHSLALDPEQSIQSVSWELLAKVIESVSTPNSARERILSDIIASLRLHGVYPQPIAELLTLRRVGLRIHSIPDWADGGEWSCFLPAQLAESLIEKLS